MRKLLKLLTILLLLMPFVMACSKNEDESWTWAEETPVYEWTEEQKYYYAFDEKIYLYEVPNQIVLSFDKKNRSDIQKVLQKNVQIKNIESDDRNNIFILTTTDSYNADALKEVLSKQKGVKSVNPAYKNNLLTDQIIVQFESWVSKYLINEMHKKYNIKVIETTELYQLLSVPFILDPLEVANAYNKSVLVNYCHPNFLVKIVTM